MIWAASAQRDCPEIVKLLLQYGADVNDKDTIYGSTVLMWASDRGNLEVAKLLLEKGADVNLKDKSGKTALMWARRIGHPEVIDLLKAHDAVE